MRNFFVLMALSVTVAVLSGGLTAVFIHQATSPQVRTKFCVDCGCLFGDECECLNCPSYKERNKR